MDLQENYKKIIISRVITSMPKTWYWITMIPLAEGHILACSLLDYAYTLIDDNN